MSAPVDVLAVMDHQNDCAGWNCLLREVRDAVAELIAADKEYDAASAALRPDIGGSADRFMEAKRRRAAALARVQP